MKNSKFAEKIEKLEKIVTELETGEISVEDSIEKYSEAMKLAKECDDILKNIEEKVAKIVSENNTETNFEE